MKYMTLILSFLILGSSCSDIATYLALREADSSPAAWIFGHTKILSISQSPIYSADGVFFYIVYFELIEDLDMNTLPKSFPQDRIKNALMALDISGQLANDKEYIYLLLPADELLSFLRKISLKWTEELTFTDDIIIFKNYSNPIYIVDLEGRELYYDEEDYIPTNIFYHKITGFSDIYQTKLQKAPIVPSLEYIEHVFEEK